MAERLTSTVRHLEKRHDAEQFCNFWRFLGSGQWYAHLRSRNVERDPSNG